MPYKVTNDDGEEIEAFSQEELEEQVRQRAEEEAQKVAEEKQAELDRIAEEKLKLEEELIKLKDKDRNFELVRRKAEGKEIEVSEEIRKQISELENKINEIAAQPKQDVKQDFVKQHIGDNKERLELFEYYYERLGSTAKSKEEVLKAATEALTLASGGEYKPDTTAGMYSTGVSKDYMSKPKEGVSEASKEFGDMLGITDEDRKKYAQK